MTIDHRLIDVAPKGHDGYPEWIQKRDTRDVLCSMARDAGAVVTDFPSHLWIEPRDWPIASLQNDAIRTWPLDYIDRYTNQGAGNGGYSTHECTTHAFRAVFEAAWNRQRRIPLGPPVPGKRLDTSATSASVWISCLSLYSEANPQQWGGAGVRQILSIAARRGCLPDKIQPRKYSFQHSLHGTCGAGGINQSRGPWLRVSQFPSGWQETAKHFKPLEYIFPASWEETVCLVLHGYAVGVGRQGHAIPYVRWIPEDNVMAYVDSYDVMRYDSISRIKSTVGGSYAIVSTTVPDNYDQPTQEE